MTRHRTYFARQHSERSGGNEPAVRPAVVPFDARDSRRPRPPTSLPDRTSLPEFENQCNAEIILTSNVDPTDGSCTSTMPGLALVRPRAMTEAENQTEGSADEEPSGEEQAILTDVYREIREDSSDDSAWSPSRLTALAGSLQVSMPFTRFFVEPHVHRPERCWVPHRRYVALPDTAREVSLVHDDGVHLSRTGRTIRMDEVSCDDSCPVCSDSGMTADVPSDLDTLIIGPPGHPHDPRALPPAVQMIHDAMLALSEE